MSALPLLSSPTLPPLISLLLTNMKLLQIFPNPQLPRICYVVMSSSHYDISVRKKITIFLCYSWQNAINPLKSNTNVKGHGAFSLIMCVCVCVFLCLLFLVLFLK